MPGVIVVCDDELLSLGLAASVDAIATVHVLEVVDHESARSAVERLRPDVVLIAATLTNPVDLLVARIQRVLPGAAVVVVHPPSVPSVPASDRVIHLKRGKNVARQIAAHIARHLGTTVAQPPSEPEPLTAQEIRVVRLMCEGLSSKTIADELSISSRTVETHRAQIYKKLTVASLAELTKLAIRKGWTSLAATDLRHRAALNQ